MNKLKNILVFMVLPVIFIALLLFNAKIAAERYKYESNTEKKNSYNAIISSETKYLIAKSGQEKVIEVNIKNKGTMAWISGEQHDIDLSYHVLDSSGKVLVAEGERTKIQGAMRSGDEATVDAKVKVPNNPGKYKVEFDMVHEGVTWFKDKGSQTYSIPLEVK